MKITQLRLKVVFSLSGPSTREDSSRFSTWFWTRSFSDWAKQVLGLVRGSVYIIQPLLSLTSIRFKICAEATQHICNFNFAVSTKTVFSLTTAAWSVRFVFASWSAVDSPWDFFLEAWYVFGNSGATFLALAVALALFTNLLDDTRSFSFYSWILPWA